MAQGKRQYTGLVEIWEFILYVHWKTKGHLQLVTGGTATTKLHTRHVSSVPLIRDAVFCSFTPRCQLGTQVSRKHLSKHIEKTSGLPSLRHDDRFLPTRGKDVKKGWSWNPIIDSLRSSNSRAFDVSAKIDFA